MPKKSSPTPANDPIQRHIDELVSMGWTYAEGKDDDTGARATVLTSGDGNERVCVTMGVTTEGGMLRAFIGMQVPTMTYEQKNDRGIWEKVDPETLEGDGK